MTQPSEFAASYTGKERRGRFSVEITASEAPQTIQLLPAPGVYEHPKGRLNITRASNKLFIKNHNSRLYQEHVPIDVEHEADIEGAVGYVGDLSMNADGSVEAKVEWTKRGKELISNDAYKYISPEWLRNWTPPDSLNTTHQNILVGAALTTRPFFKDLRPLVASEGKLYDLDGEERTEIVRASDEFDEMILKNALDSNPNLAGGVLTEVTDDYAIITVTDNGTNVHYQVDYEYDEEADELELTEPVGVQSRRTWETSEEDTNKAKLHRHKKRSNSERSNMAKVEDLVKGADELDEEEQESLFAKLAKKFGIKIAAHEESEEEKEKREKEEAEEKEKVELKAKEEKEKEEKDKDEMTPTEKTLTKELATANSTIKASAEEAKKQDERIAAIESTTRVNRFRDLVLGRDESGSIKAREDKKTLHPFIGDHEDAMTMLTTIAEAHGEDSKEFAAYVAREREHADQIHEAGTFKETGVAGSGVVPGSAKEEFDGLVQEAMKANDKLSEGDAISVVAKESGDLYNKVDKEATKRLSDFPGS